MVLMKSFFLQSASISVNLKKLMQGANYEKILLKLMTESTLVFPGEYEHIEKQAKGECDFVEKVTKIKFDAKLVLNKEQGKNIFSKQGNVNNYAEIMRRQVVEFSEHMSQGRKDIESCGLYKAISENIAKTQDDENAILFIPYPIVPDVEHNPLKGSKDFLTYIFNALKTNKVVGERCVYAVYLTGDGKTVLRNLDTDEREYINCIELTQYISYKQKWLKEK